MTSLIIKHIIVIIISILLMISAKQRSVTSFKEGDTNYGRVWYVVCMCYTLLGLYLASTLVLMWVSL